MRLLMIAAGYPPYLFSENLCNGKLVMALMEAGIEVDVITKEGEGPSYGKGWENPWDILKASTHIISYHVGNKVQRLCDSVYSGLKLDGNFIAGARWLRRAYEKAEELISKNHYDAVLTRSPSENVHLVGLKLKKKYGLKWIANWNDPVTVIWPKPGPEISNPKKAKKYKDFTSKLLNAADIVSFPGANLRDHYCMHFPELRSKSTCVIPHIGMIDKNWPAADQKFNSGKLMMLHSGNLPQDRDPDLTFRAMRRLIDEGCDKFEFHIMGHIEEYILKEIEKYSLSDYVKFVGMKPYMVAISAMQAYDVLVLIEAKYEKGIFFASKIVDYLQAGKPVFAISPKEGFASDLFVAEDTQYFADNRDEEAIYVELKRMYMAWEKGQLADNSSKQMFQAMSPITIAEQYKNIVSNLT